MANQQLLDYIAHQMQLGTNTQQIQQSLIAHGWPIAQIDEALNSIQYIAQNQPASPISHKTPISVGIIITASLILVAIGGSGIYFYNQTFSQSSVAPEVSRKISNPLPAEKPTETLPPSEPPTPQAPSQNPELLFADKLSSCEVYKTTFKHLFTGETLEKEILGLIDGKCNYVEEMPNGGKMECKYTESQRIAVAQYYKEATNAESVGTSISASLGSDQTQTTYTIDDKVVENPLAEAMNSGVCIISGY